MSPKSARRRNYKKRHPDKLHAWKARSKEKHSCTGRASNAMFVGVDGEGGGRDDKGRQNYLLLRAGDDLLFADNIPLGTEDLLEFLTGLPTAGRYYVGYYFDYDVTMILRDVEPEKQIELLQRRVPKLTPGHNSRKGNADSILWRNWEIGYFPRKHFKCRRIAPEGHKENKNPWVVIHDVGTFFQCKFSKALTDWDAMPADQIKLIEADKARRASFETMTQREIDYNKREVDGLANLMEKFRAVCQQTGYVPKQWEGPGWLASCMMGRHKVPKTKQIEDKVPPGCWRAANDAYYGGRFEIFKVGHVDDCNEYDICSAYPTSYVDLPCLLHAQWEHGEGELPKDYKLYLARVRYSHKEENPIVCNLPFRTKTGSLRWQREGQGWFWSIEIEAAKTAGTVIAEVMEWWAYRADCDCKPFGNWVPAVYAERLLLGKDRRGYPLKLALNSVYGKCCQSIGHPPFANPIWAGLITAATRVRLIEAYAPLWPAQTDRLIMLATDGVYVVGDLGHLREKIGKRLGDWEHPKQQGIFIVKPGMYAWDDGTKVKTRGVPAALFEEIYQDMRAQFDAWIDEQRIYAKTAYPIPIHKREFPTFTVIQKLFISNRLALHLKKPETAGKWVSHNLRHSFDPVIKRHVAGVHPTQRYVQTLAHLGGPFELSTPYNKAIGVNSTTEELKRFMADVIAAEPFAQQVASINFGLMISGLPDAALFDSDMSEDLDDTDLADLG